MASLNNDDLMALDDVLTDNVAKGIVEPYSRNDSNKSAVVWEGFKQGTKEKAAVNFDVAIKEHGFDQAKINKLTTTDFAVASDILAGEADANNAKTRLIIRSSATQHPLFLHDDGYYYDVNGFRLYEQPPLAGHPNEGIASVAKVAIAMGLVKDDGKETWTVTSPNYYDYSNKVEYANDCALFDAEFGGKAVTVDGGRWQGTPRPASAAAPATKSTSSAAPATAAARYDDSYTYYNDYGYSYGGYYYDDDILYYDDDYSYSYDF